MFNFFANEEPIDGVFYEIRDKDYNHIINVLRMKIDDKFYVSSNGHTDLCKISDVTDECVIADIIEKDYIKTELPVNICLFQALPKSDKMELVIQKTVELGVSEITPVSMKRCVVKLDDKKKASKVNRWQAIAESAAKQSKRNIIPKVQDVLSFKQLLKVLDNYDLFIVPYENERGMAYTKEVLDQLKPGMSIGILIGPEGGFDDSEIDDIRALGAKVISLGNRILRTETAAITTCSMCMFAAELLGE